jgi:hypothetical protein
LTTLGGILHQRNIRENITGRCDKSLSKEAEEVPEKLGALVRQ